MRLLLTSLAFLTIIVLPEFSYAQNARKIAKAVEVLEGQELLIFNRSTDSLNAFKAEAGSQLKHLSASANVTIINKKLAVAGISSNGRGGMIKTHDEDNLKAACDKIRSTKLGCEINYAVKLVKTANDTSWSALYGLTKIAADTAWDTTTGSKSVKVAVIDTGVDYTHSDLASNIAINTAEIADNNIDDDGNGYVDDYYGYNFADQNSNPYDDNSHGTHVAGTIGAVGNNSNGVTGVNWEVGIIPVKVLDASGSGTVASVIMGVNYAVARGAHVLNLSLGGGGYSQSFYDAINNANNAGALFVAAAGNEANNNDSEQSYPAGYNLPNVISVAATDSNDALASFSNYGSSVHIAAPGVSIRSTLPSNAYGSYSGTSMATPHVAGAAALLKAFSPASSMLQIKSALLNHADFVAGLSGKVATSARINVARAMSALSGGTVPEPPVSQPPSSPPPADLPGDGDGGDDAPPADGIDDPDQGEDDLYAIDYIGVQQKVSGSKAKLTIFLLDSEDYGVVDASVSLTCDGQVIGTKISDLNGDTKFSVKLKKGKMKCEAVAANALSTMSKKFFLKRTLKKR